MNKYRANALLQIARFLADYGVFVVTDTDGPYIVLESRHNATRAIADLNDYGNGRLTVWVEGGWMVEQAYFMGLPTKK